MYLPQAVELTEVFADPLNTDVVVGGHGAILIVEDDSLVRNFALTQIQSLGYTTLTANNAAEALAIVDAGKTIDLLFTDVIMPGAMDGR